MKVYLLQVHNDDECETFGVYSSKEKALESFPYCGYSLTEEDIKEVELDPPNDPERYEVFFYAQIWEDGTGFQDSGDRKLPSDTNVQKVHYIKRHDRKMGVAAYGRTVDEAMQKAAAALPSLHPVWQVSRYRDNPTKFNEMQHPHPSCIHRFEDIEGLEDTVYAVHEDLNLARIAILEYERTGAIAPYMSHPSNRQLAQP